MKASLSPLISYTLLFFGVFALSTSAIFVRLADAPATVTAFYRMLFAATMLLPFLLLSAKNRQELKLLSKKQWGLGLLSGGFLAAHYALWFESLSYTSVASSTVIVTLQPLFSMVGGFYLFKERFSKGAILGCIIAISGSMVIGWQDFQISGQALFGDILAFIAAGLITAYFFIGQHVRKTLSLVPYSIIGYSSSAVILGVAALGQQNSLVHYSTQTWWSFLGLALIATIFGQTIFNWLLKWISTTVISMSILGEAIGTIFLAYIILKEVISLQQGLGIFLILCGLALFIVKQKKMSNTGEEKTNLTAGNEI